MKTIYLIGFMGAGKTTIGRVLGEKLSLPVYDTDIEISNYTGKTVSAIFEEDGEGFFRKLEGEILKTLPKENAIITTGGGIILQPDNRKWMYENGSVVFLNATPNEIFKRLERDETRPLLKEDKLNKVSQLMDLRMPLYLEASNIIIETTEKSIESIVNELLERLKSK